MIEEDKFLYKEKYKFNLAFLFLISFIFFQPMLKYSEYVLNFPRINYSIFIVVIFCLYIIVEIPDLFRKRYNFDLWFSFWIILFLSGLQIISSPWSITYGLNGSEQFLKVVSKTFFCYWMFWFCGLHIDKIISNTYTKVALSISWIISLFMILISALNNDVFAILLEGTLIYLMLGDAFAVLSIFMLIYNKKFDILIILLSSVALFALWSRASLYSFIIISFLYMLREHKVRLLLLLLLSFIVYSQINFSKDHRMLTIIFGGIDTSQNIRDQLLQIGLNEIKMVWPFGNFMGDVNSNHGHSGTYIHSYLSYLRQFGIIPFISLIIFGLFYYFKISILWIQNNNKIVRFLFYFTTFILIEVIFARSYTHPYVFLSLSAMPSVLNDLR